jgi:hypothetical protein
LGDHGVERNDLAVELYVIVGEDHLVARKVSRFAYETYQPRLDLLASVEVGHSVEVGPEEAAVAEVFGTFSAVVFVTLIRSRSTWKASAAT